MPNLHVDPDDYRAVLAHLLPVGDGREQAAFLFATRAEGSDDFTVVDAMLMGAADLAEQYSDYLELTEEARIRVTKRARPRRVDRRNAFASLPLAGGFLAC